MSVEAVVGEAHLQEEASLVVGVMVEVLKCKHEKSWNAKGRPNETVTKKTKIKSKSPPWQESQLNKQYQVTDMAKDQLCEVTAGGRYNCHVFGLCDAAWDPC